MSTVDAIVVSYNTRELLQRCVASLVASSIPLGEVFVVDNASLDGSAEMVAEEFPNVRLIKMPSNVGFAKANNVAFQQSTADHVLLLNSDAEIAADGLRLMLGELESDPAIAAVGPVLVGSDGRVQYEGGRRDPSILGEFGNISHLNRCLPDSRFGCYLMSDWDHLDSRDIEVLSGACMLVRVAALNGQLFRDDFFMYGEDVELCQRLRRHGYRLRYFGGTHVLHHGGASSKKARTRMRVAGVISMAQLLARERGPVYALGYLLAVPIAWPLGVLVRNMCERVQHGR